MVTITSLRPAGDTFDPTLKNKIKPNFYFTCASFRNYIEGHHEDHEKVSDYKHIAFLTLWLSHFVFCSSSLQMVKKFIAFPTQVHEGRNIYHSKLILAYRYESLGLVYFGLKSITHPYDKLLFSGPMWLLQLWLNATFEPYLNLTIPYDLARKVEDRRVQGTRISFLTPEYTGVCKTSILTLRPLMQFHHKH